MTAHMKRAARLAPEAARETATYEQNSTPNCPICGALIENVRAGLRAEAEWLRENSIVVDSRWVNVLRSYISRRIMPLLDAVLPCPSRAALICRAKRLIARLETPTDDDELLAIACATVRLVAQTHAEGM
ncbi:MAG: hypothetical protein ACYC9Z_13735 [Casimicrobiaceae bacterium]